MRFTRPPTPMPSSPRVQCPFCYSFHIEGLTDVLSLSKEDYFRCKECRRMWSVPAGEDGPADLKPPPKRPN